MINRTLVLRSWRLVAFLALAAGCGPRMAPAGVSLAVRRPPPPRVEVISVAPGPRYIWVPGHHAWQAGDYVWISGAWLLPPETRFRRWEPGHWAEVRGGWYWIDGRWR